MINNIRKSKNLVKENKVCIQNKTYKLTEMGVIMLRAADNYVYRS